MRKIFFVFMIMVLVLTASTICVFAYSIGISLVPNVASISQGDTITFTVSIKDLDVGEEGINVFVGTIEYDLDIFNTLTTNDITPLNDWGGKEFNPINGRIVLDRGTSVNENSDILSFTLTAKTDAVFEPTTISLKNVQVSNGEDDINAINTSYIINIVEPKQDPVKPNIMVEYTTVTNGVKVTLKSDKPLIVLEGWTLSDDKMSLSKIYEESYLGTVIVEDQDGLKSDEVTINVTVQKQIIDITKPTGVVRYTETTDGIIATITASEEIQEVSGWTLSEDKKVLTKKFTTNYTGSVVLIDLAGNKSDDIQIKIEIKLKEENVNTNTNKVVNNSNSTINTPIPKAGFEDYVIVIITILIACGVGAFIKFRKTEF